MFNPRIANSKSPCLNCTERWIDTVNMKRCDSHCDKRADFLKCKVAKEVVDLRVTANKRCGVRAQNRVLIYEFNEAK